MSRSTTALPPGGTIGILGGGPMGRMISLAARTLGYRVHLLDTTGSQASPGIAELSITTDRLDTRAVAEVARGCDVITVAFEDVPEAILEIAATHAILRPGLRQIAIAQERQREREWLEAAGFPLLPWRATDSRDELVAAVRASRGPCIIKPRTRRRAGFRPLLVTSEGEALAAWVAVRGLPTIVEEFALIDREISVLVARSPDGSVCTYPPAVSVRDQMQLAWSILPGPIVPALATKARELASYVARRLEIEGLLTVEMFLLTDGRLVVNEIVPCPHPTYHGAEMACVTGQVEQLIRAIAGLPLGSTSERQPTASMSLTGGTSGGAALKGFERALLIPGVRAHLYETAEPLAGRPVGHLCALGGTANEAVTRLLLAQAKIDPRRARHLERHRQREAHNALSAPRRSRRHAPTAR